VPGTLVGEILPDLMLMAACYGYVLAMILVSERLQSLIGASRGASRKFLHAMIGNLPLVIPFFRWTLAPFIVAAPFIAVTFLASPASPLTTIRDSLDRLTNLTEEGHPFGLVFYAVSYSLLALIFPSKPYVIAAGVLPMAYGDSAAYLVGERYGRHRYMLVHEKSLEGSLAMFTASFLSLTANLVYFSAIYGLQATEQLVLALAVSLVVAVVESISPRGLDNLTVPFLGAATYLYMAGWM